jgi:hypothetical protein
VAGRCLSAQGLETLARIWQAGVHGSPVGWVSFGAPAGNYSERRPLALGTHPALPPRSSLHKPGWRLCPISHLTNIIITVVCICVVSVACIVCCRQRSENLALRPTYKLLPLLLRLTSVNPSFSIVISIGRPADCIPSLAISARLSLPRSAYLAPSTPLCPGAIHQPQNHLTNYQGSFH